MDRGIISALIAFALLVIGFLIYLFVTLFGGHTAFPGL